MVSNISKGAAALTGYWECAGKPEDPKWLKAYMDSGGVWTIGIGTIRYPNGKPVKKGDVITAAQRDEYYIYEMRNKVDVINFVTRDDISQSQFDAVSSLVYNIGTSALKTSTLLKMLNKDLNDMVLVNRFLDWRFDNGVEVSGLVRRRMSEAYYYFTGQLRTSWVYYKKFVPNTVAEVKDSIIAFRKAN